MNVKKYLGLPFSAVEAVSCSVAYSVSHVSQYCTFHRKLWPTVWNGCWAARRAGICIGQVEKCCRCNPSNKRQL